MIVREIGKSHRTELTWAVERNATNLNPERVRPLLGHNIVALERLTRRSFEGTAYESQAIGELYLLRG